MKYLGFDDSFDDSMLRKLNKTTNTEPLSGSDSEENDGKDCKTTNETDKKREDSVDDEITFKSRAKQIQDDFVKEVLPKVHTMANGMKLLGVENTNPLAKQGDVYKLHIARPDAPIGYSEAWEDRTTIRLNSYAKLISEETLITNFRVELATLIPGIQDDDVVGLKATKGI